LLIGEVHGVDGFVGEAHGADFVIPRKTDARQAREAASGSERLRREKLAFERHARVDSRNGGFCGGKREGGDGHDV
jgi:hypothetical protein